MIICSCAHITTKDVTTAISWMRASDPLAVITPGKLYRALGKRPDCGGCIRLLVENMRSELTRSSSETAQTDNRISRPGLAGPVLISGKQEAAIERRARTDDLPTELRNLRPGR